MIRSFFLSLAGRFSVLGCSLICAVGGVISLAEPASVSSWADMQAVGDVGPLPDQCGTKPTYPGTVNVFEGRSGKRFAPAVSVGSDITFPSFRRLDRAIEGTFHAKLVSENPAVVVDLADFDFSSGMFPGVQEGCRVSAYTISISADFDQALETVVRSVNEANRATRWRLVQSVDIEGAARETWSSERFWIIPQGLTGSWERQAVSINDVFFVGSS